MITRRSFLRSIVIGVAGYIATKQISLNADTKPLVAQLEEPTPTTAYSHVIPQYRRYNPFSPTGLCINWVPAEPKYIVHS